MKRLLILICLACRLEAGMDTLSVGPVQDRRFEGVRHLDMAYSFKAPATRKAWEQRAKHLRAQILTGTGLMPMPEKTPLNARVFGRVEHDDYTVEKVYFESFPDFYVTGNLYRPRGKIGPFPAVLNPHGHGQEGRLEDTERSSGPGRAITFARQGCVAFAYDMIGYNDSSQLRHREDLIGERFRLWGISMGGLQLWNSIRAVDFLTSLPDVDPCRIACTGASGGGTQTFMLTAIDDRVICCAPVCMVSSTMQGGCVCENPPLIRLDTNNMEIAALAAPRPQILVSATGDWTKLTPEVEYPAVKSVYNLLGASERVACALFDAEHNYNKQSREAVYPWFGRWLLGDADPSAFREPPFDADKPEDVMVFGRDPHPSGALDVDGIVKSRVEASESQLLAYGPRDAESCGSFQTLYGNALRHALAVEIPPGKDITVENRGNVKAGGIYSTKLVIGRRGKGDAIPALLLSQEPDGSGAVTLFVCGSGKDTLFRDGKPAELLGLTLDCGRSVLAIDCFGVREHSVPEGFVDRLTRYKFFDTYNRTDTMERVQDIVTAAAYLKSTMSEISLVGVGDGGLWSLLALPFAPWVESAAVDVARFDTSSDEELIERLYAPCLRRVGDLRTAGALVAPRRLMIHNAGRGFEARFIRTAFNACGRADSLSIMRTQAPPRRIVEWIGVSMDTIEKARD